MVDVLIAQSRTRINEPLDQVRAGGSDNGCRSAATDREEGERREPESWVSTTRGGEFVRVEDGVFRRDTADSRVLGDWERGGLGEGRKEKRREEENRGVKWMGRVGLGWMELGRMGTVDGGEDGRRVERGMMAACV